MRNNLFKALVALALVAPSLIASNSGYDPGHIETCIEVLDYRLGSNGLDLDVALFAYNDGFDYEFYAIKDNIYKVRAPYPLTQSDLDEDYVLLKTGYLDARDTVHVKLSTEVVNDTLMTYRLALKRKYPSSHPRSKFPNAPIYPEYGFYAVESGTRVYSESGVDARFKQLLARAGRLEELNLIETGRIEPGRFSSLYREIQNGQNIFENYFSKQIK